jgi:hypothetical protein
LTSGGDKPTRSARGWHVRQLAFSSPVIQSVTINRDGSDSGCGGARRRDLQLSETVHHSSI